MKPKSGAPRAASIRERWAHRLGIGPPGGGPCGYFLVLVVLAGLNVSAAEFMQ